MSLLVACKTFLEDELEWSETTFVGEILDPNATACNLVLHTGNDRDDPTRTHRHPVVQLFIRRTTEAAARTDIDEAYKAFNVVGRLALTPSYRCHSACPLGPVELGQDGRKLWRASLDIYFSIRYSAAI